MASVVVTAGAPRVQSVAVATATASEVAARDLWNEHYASLAGWCAALVGDREAAQDIASEAFLRLWSRWFTVHDPKGYLYVTATNLVRDRWRREQRDRRLRARLEETAPVSTPACDPWLRDLVERLPGRLRAPVLLFYYADMSVAEVATALHKPEGTVKRMLSDARAQLGTWLKSDR
jgi:RNA polymerase sigma-70 factor (ECF subfamily)